MALTYQQAATALRAAVARAESLGVRMSISIMDARGDLVAFARIDGARHYTVDIAHGKARVAAFFGQPADVMGQRIGEPALTSLIQLNHGQLMFVQGGLPLSNRGEHVGGIGVSGGSGQQDEDAARAGAATLQ